MYSQVYYAGAWWNSAEARAAELAGEVLGELSGVADARRCVEGSASGCAWATIGFLPFDELVRLGRLARFATNTGVRSLAGAGDELAQGGVYALRDPVTGQVVRTGRTNDLVRRQGEHFRDPALSDFEFEVIARTDVYAQQRGLEQLLHDTYSPALNRINPISPANPNRGSYLNAAEEFLSSYGAG